MKDQGIGDRFCVIRTRRARSAWTRCSCTAKIYSPHGQTYEAVDRNLLLSYKESPAAADPARGSARPADAAVIVARDVVLRRTART
jgi:pyruvate dehydrogenase E1 component